MIRVPVELYVTSRRVPAVAPGAARRRARNVWVLVKAKSTVICLSHSHKSAGELRKASSTSDACWANRKRCLTYTSITVIEREGKEVEAKAHEDGAGDEGHTNEHDLTAAHEVLDLRLAALFT